MMIAVIGGAGHVGLVAASCFAETGHTVTVHDLPAQIRSLSTGRLPFFEPLMEELFTRNVKMGRLLFCEDLAATVAAAEICFLTLPTPSESAGRADTRIVLQVAEQIAAALDDYKIIVLKSTVPVGTADRVREVISQRTSHPFAVVSNPEFMKEGAAVEDFSKPDRVVLGGDNAAAIKRVADLYLPFVRTGNPILTMDNRSAELSKYALNAALAARISFINEIATLCEAVGADIDQVRTALATDSRIGSDFLFPGMGWGGSCFKKDLSEARGLAAEYGVETPIFAAVQAVNDAQMSRLFLKAARHFGPRLDQCRMALWGLAFKPETDDMREAPAQVLIAHLLAARARVTVYDPKASSEAQRLFGDRLQYAREPYDALDGADALFVATEWNEFRQLDLDRATTLLKSPVIFDGRNLYDLDSMRKAGFTYYSIGRPDVIAS